LFEPEAMAVLDAAAASARLGEETPAALDQPTALTIAPEAVLRAWAPDARHARVAMLEGGPGRWILRGADGAALGEAEAVIVAAGLASGALCAVPPLTAVRGQASWAELADPPVACAWGGYAVPTSRGVLFGATHDRGDERLDLRAGDHARNVATLEAALPR